jgi:hypothetical protein
MVITLSFPAVRSSSISPAVAVPAPLYYNVYVKNSDGNIKAYSQYTYSVLPQPGSSGLITASTAPNAAQQVDLTWSTATDSNTPQNQLQYCIYSSYVANIGVDEATAQAKIVTYSAAFAAAASDPTNVLLQETWSTTLASPTNIKQLGVHGQKYFFNIFVKNSSGFISAYVPVAGTTKP